MNNNDQKPLPNQLSTEIDSKEDQEKMQEENTQIDLPGVEDIPGQENYKVPIEGLSGDETLASSDEEGERIFGDNIDDELGMGPDSNVSQEERSILHTAANDMPGDDEDLREAALDSTDEDGTPLNVDSFDGNISPNDLDVPGASEDDAEEKIGGEDEENNEYSISDNKD